MDIQSLVNHNNNIHTSPTAIRFYQLQQQRQARDARPGPVQRGLRHSTPLTLDEKIQIRTLRAHTNWSYLRIAQATGTVLAGSQFSRPLRRMPWLGHSMYGNKPFPPRNVAMQKAIDAHPEALDVGGHELVDPLTSAQKLPAPLPLHWSIRSSLPPTTPSMYYLSKAV
ncbi:hypothetical protein VTI74DRAFT_7110 [Chaetomium olivicolor]